MLIHAELALWRSSKSSFGIEQVTRLLKADYEDEILR